VRPLSDLSLVKTVDPEVLSPGEPATFTLTVDNAGPSVARDVSVTDPVDPALEITAVDGADCEVGDTGTVSCDLGDLAPGAEPVVITVDVDVPAGYASDTFANSAVVSSATEDPDAGNNTGTVSGPAAPLADLSVTNTAVSDRATPGTEVTWRVVVRNDGPATARAVTLTEALPAGVTLVSVTGGDASCDLATGTCSLGDLAPGQVVTLTVVAAVADDYDQPTVTSTASVTAATNDPDTTDDVASSTLGAAGSADLSLVKTVDPGTLSPGEPATFTLTVDNAGPSVARDVRVLDPVDPALEVTDVTGADCEVGGTGTVACELGDLAPDADPVVITVEVDVPADHVADTFANSAVVSSATPDPVAEDNTGTVSGPAAARADLSVVTTPVSDVAVPGGQASWTVVVTNEGPALARGVTLSEALPAGVTLVSLTGEGVVCDTATGLCTVGDLAPGESRTITVVAEVDPGYDQPTVTSTAGVASPTVDPDETDNVSSSTLPVVPGADLSLVKTVDPEVLSPGEPATFTLTVVNDGPSVARQVTVTDPVDPALTVTAVDGADCQVDQDGVVTCDLGDLAPDADPVVITIDADVPADYAPATFTNSATVVSAVTPDPDEADNTGTVSGDAAAWADLALTKTTLAPLTAGTQGSWELTVVNEGPALAREVSVTDQLPAGATPVGTDGCTPVGSTVTCSVPELAPGASATFTVTADLASDLDGTLTNTATVGSTTPEIDPGDNTATTTDPVGRVSDLRVSKTVDATEARQGDVVTWTVVVTNDGPSDADAVEVQDDWPEGAQLLGHDADQGELDPSTGLWSVGTLAVGASATLTLEARLTGTGEVENTASATSDSVDPDPSGDVASAAVEVAPAEPPVDPTEPPVDPTQPPVDPTQPP
ncbi:DUF11 domain-containing protein, partial [Auraticoccus sp. F435]